MFFPPAHNYSHGILHLTVFSSDQKIWIMTREQNPTTEVIEKVNAIIHKNNIDLAPVDKADFICKGHWGSSLFIVTKFIQLALFIKYLLTATKLLTLKKYSCSHNKILCWPISVKWTIYLNTFVSCNTIYFCYQ